MNPRLPVVSAKAVIRALEKFSYEVVRQNAAMCDCAIPAKRKDCQSLCPCMTKSLIGTLKRIPAGR